MAGYDPQRSRPRRRVTDDAGPAPVDELLDPSPDRSPSPDPAGPQTGRSTDRPTDRPTDDARPSSDPVASNGAEGAPRPSAAPAATVSVASKEVVDLAPVPDTAPAATPRRVRYALVAVIVILALTGFVVRRVGAARRARRA